MLEIQTPEPLVASIKEAPHWRLVVRPGEFVEERIGNLSECWRLIESSRISLRGWDYPHLDYQQRQYGGNWVASWDEFQSHREYWRFYQSGQFLHLFAFKEDHYRNKAEEKAKSDAPALNDLSPSGYVEAISALWTITEVFEFAARLVQKADFGDSISITIQMVEVSDRVLYLSDPARDFPRPYIAKESTLGKEWILDTKELLGASSVLALDAAMWFFERFQWMDPPRQALADEQRRLLERKF